MKAGDLIMFRDCTQQGKLGIVSLVTEPSPLARENPELRIYWVLVEEELKCFTGSQLVLQ
jgi:hypothetical protein